jgi:hypothetical protein
MSKTTTTTTSTRARAIRAMVMGAAGLTVALLGCKGQTLDPTSLVVSVNSDLTAGTDFDQITIDVTTAHGDEPFVFSIGSSADLPVTQALLPSGDRAETFMVTATATLGGATVVSQSVQTTFIPGSVGLLQMDLVRGCIAVACDPSFTCDAGACGPNGRTPTGYNPGLPDAGSGDTPGSGGAGGGGGGAGGGNADMKLQYYTMTTATPSNSIQPSFKIVNMGSSAVALQDLTIRYWFTDDGNTDELQGFCDYAMAGGVSVTGSVTLGFQPVGQNVMNADYYFEVGFTPDAGSIDAVGGQSDSRVNTRFNTKGFFKFKQDNDYSFNATNTDYADWPQVTLYQRGQLIWGVEPPPH